MECPYIPQLIPISPCFECENAIVIPLPMIIFSSTNPHSLWSKYLGDEKEKWFVTCLQSGYIIHSMYFNVEWIKNCFPQKDERALLDAHVFHKNISLIDTCKKNMIALCILLEISYS